MSNILCVNVESNLVLGIETGSGAGSSREVVRLRKQIQQLTEENNLLKFKNELLMDMV